MFKKMMLLGLLLVVFGGSLFATVVQDPPPFYSGYKIENNPNLRELAIEYLKKNRVYQKDVNSKCFGIKIYQNNEMEIPFKGYKAYIIAFHGCDETMSGYEWIPMRVVFKDGIFFKPFREFNRILKYEGIKIDSTNANEIIKTFLKFSEIYHPKTLTVEKINNVHIEKRWKYYSEIYNYEAYTYQKINGVKCKYLIDLRNGYIAIYQAEILDVYKGDYIRKRVPWSVKKMKCPPVFLDINSYKKDITPSIEIIKNDETIVSFDSPKNPFQILQLSML